MHYYIDGYNLLFFIADDFDDLSIQRQQVIVELNHKIQALKLNATLIFDAHFQSGDATRTHFNYLEILFSPEGETADDFILRLLEKEAHPSQFTVVTSDRKLAWKARRLDVKTEEVFDFLTKLNKRYANVLKRWKAPETIRQDVQKTPSESKTPTKVLKPSKDASPEECFDYYLYLFEKSIKGKKKKEEKGVTDMERWLKIFENRSKP